MRRELPPGPPAAVRLPTAPLAELAPPTAPPTVLPAPELPPPFPELAVQIEGESKVVPLPAKPPVLAIVCATPPVPTETVYVLITVVQTAEYVPLPPPAPNEEVELVP